MFGECVPNNEHQCKHRHIFGANDTSTTHCSFKSSIKFHVVNVLSPTHYVIRVSTQKVGANWSSLEEENRNTEALLSNELQQFCTNSENLKKTDIIANGSFVALFEKTWRRCKAITDVL